MNREILINPEDMPQETPEQKAISEQLKRIAEEQEHLDRPKSLKDFDVSIDQLAADKHGEDKQGVAQRTDKLKELRDERDKYYESLLDSLLSKKVPKSVQAHIKERAEIDSSWRVAVKEWSLKNPGKPFPDAKRAEFMEKMRKAEYKIEKAVKNLGDIGQEDGMGAGANERQQNKIIKILETGNVDILNQSVARVSDKERAAVLGKIHSGGFSEEELRVVVHEVAPAYKDKRFSTRLTQIREREGHEEGLFRRFISLFDNPGNQRSVTFSIGLQRLLESCPTVDLLQDRLDDLISDAQTRSENRNLDSTQREMVRRNLSLRKQLRGRDFEEFAEIVYGKQKEYWDQVKLLIQEARGQ